MDPYEIFSVNQAHYLFCLFYLLNGAFSINKNEIDATLKLITLGIVKTFGIFTIIKLCCPDNMIIGMCNLLLYIMVSHVVYKFISLLYNNDQRRFTFTDSFRNFTGRRDLRDLRDRRNFRYRNDFENFEPYHRVNEHRYRRNPPDFRNNHERRNPPEFRCRRNNPEPVNSQNPREYIHVNNLPEINKYIDLIVKYFTDLDYTKWAQFIMNNQSKFKYDDIDWIKLIINLSKCCIIRDKTSSITLLKEFYKTTCGKFSYDYVCLTPIDDLEFMHQKTPFILDGIYQLRSIRNIILDWQEPEKSCVGCVVDQGVNTLFNLAKNIDSKCQENVAECNNTSENPKDYSKDYPTFDL